MPLLNGFEASEKIYEFIKENKLTHIPIYAFTGRNDPDQVAKCKKAGIRDIFLKPIPLDLVKDIIDYNRYNISF